MALDALCGAAGALLVATLNELRAQWRARQADEDRRERLADADATAAIAEWEATRATIGDG